MVCGGLKTKKKQKVKLGENIENKRFNQFSVDLSYKSLAYLRTRKIKTDARVIRLLINNKKGISVEGLAILMQKIDRITVKQKLKGVKRQNSEDCFENNFALAQCKVITKSKCFFDQSQETYRGQ